MGKEKNYTVKICEEYVVCEPDKVKKILDRVAKTITNTYMRKENK